MKRRTKLIFNPHADRGHAWEIVHILQGVIDRYGEADWATTEYPNHAMELARQAADEGYQVVAALGGDGTVHEAINGLMQLPPEHRPLLGAVPIGSGNDFCSNNGIPVEPEKAILRVFEGEPKAIDLGRIRDNTGREKFWDNTISIGFGASVAIHAYKITRLRGFLMYLWAVILTILKNYDAPQMRFETDREQFEQNVLLLSLNNGRREGGGFLTSPAAVSDDGVLNYAMIEQVSRPMMFRLIPEVMRGTHGRFRQVRLGEFEQLKLTSEAPFPIHTDGEIFAGFGASVTAIEVDVLPGALQILA